MTAENDSELRSELRSLRALLEAIRAGDQKALELQAKEYERRLDELNHHRTSMAAKESHFVSRELHDREFARVDRDVSSLSRLVWIGVGIALVGQGLLLAAFNHMVKS